MVKGIVVLHLILEMERENVDSVSSRLTREQKGEVKAVCINHASNPKIR